MSSLKLNDLKVSDGTDEKLIVQKDIIKKNDKFKNETILYSEALSQAGFGKFNYFLIFISGMILANVLLETTAMGFILPIAECDLKLTNKDKGVLSAIGFTGIIVSSHLWGFLADTKGRRKVIMPTLLCGFIVSFLSSFSNRFWIMVVLRFISGFCASGGSATIYAYLGEYHTERTRSRAMMGSAFVFALGAMILPVIAFIVINREWILPIPLLNIDYKPWRLFLVVVAAPGFLCGLSLLTVPESPKFLLSLGKEDEAMNALRQMHRWNGMTDEFTFAHILPDENIGDEKMKQNNTTTDKKESIVKAFLVTMWNQTVPLFGKKYLRTTLIVCIIQFWLFVITNGLYIWFPHIINSMAEFMNQHPGEHKRICQIVYDRHESLYKTDGSIECITKLEHKTYFYSLLMEITYASSFAFIGLVINRIGKIPVLFITTIFFSSCGIAAVLISNPAIASYLYVLLFLVGVGINVLSAATVDYYPTHLRAMAICIALMVGRLGGVVGANFVGAFLANQCELTFYVSCISTIACAFLTILLPRRSVDEEPKKDAISNS